MRAWLDGKMVDWREITVSPLSHGFSRGMAIIEVAQLVRTQKGPSIFIHDDHLHRFYTSATLAGSLRARFEAFGLAVSELDSSDVMEIQPLAQRGIDAVRSLHRPQALILNTCRFGPHSKGDDTRPVEEVEAMKASRDPVALSRARLGAATVKALEQQIDAEVKQAFEQALADAYPLAEVQR